MQETLYRGTCPVICKPMATSLASPSCSSTDSAYGELELTSCFELLKRTAVKSETPESVHICVFFLQLSRVQIRKAILTERRQGHDLPLCVGEFGVAEQAGDVLPVVLRCREDDPVSLRARIRAALLVHIFTSGWHRLDLCFWSTSRRDARDHPEIPSSHLHHLCSNGHIWFFCKAGRSQSGDCLSRDPKWLLLCIFPAR